MFWNILITDNLASWWWCNVLKNQDFLFTSWTYLHFKMEGWLEEDAQTKERERCSKNQYLKITAKHLNQKERWETKEIYSYCGSCREIGRGHEYLIPYIFVKRADICTVDWSVSGFWNKQTAPKVRATYLLLLLLQQPISKLDTHALSLSPWLYLLSKFHLNFIYINSLH